MKLVYTPDGRLVGQLADRVNGGATLVVLTSLGYRVVDPTQVIVVQAP